MHLVEQAAMQSSGIRTTTPAKTDSADCGALPSDVLPPRTELVERRARRPRSQSSFLRLIQDDTDLTSAGNGTTETQLKNRQVVFVLFGQLGVVVGDVVRLHTWVHEDDGGEMGSRWGIGRHDIAPMFSGTMVMDQNRRSGRTIGTIRNSTVLARSR